MMNDDDTRRPTRSSQGEVACFPNHTRTTLIPTTHTYPSLRHRLRRRSVPHVQCLWGRVAKFRFRERRCSLPCFSTAPTQPF